MYKQLFSPSPSSWFKLYWPADKGNEERETEKEKKRIKRKDCRGARKSSGVQPHIFGMGARGGDGSGWQQGNFRNGHSKRGRGQFLPPSLFLLVSWYRTKGRGGRGLYPPPRSFVWSHTAPGQRQEEEGKRSSSLSSFCGAGGGGGDRRPDQARRSLSRRGSERREKKETPAGG